MSTLIAPPRLASACAVFLGGHGAVSRLARDRAVPRQTLYREAKAAAADLDGAAHREQLADLRQALADRQAQCDEWQRRLEGAVVLDADKQAEFAACAQAQGVSLAQARALLKVLLGDAAPSTAALGRLTRAAGRRAGALLAVLDESSRGRARQVAADEIFAGRKPILMTVEQHSLCWLGGRLAANRDSETWAEEFRTLPVAEQVTADGGQGLRKGLALANAARRQQGKAEIAEQRDHFHALQRARRAARAARHQAARALATAEEGQKGFDADGRAGRPRTGSQSRRLKRDWAKAEAAFDAWSAQEAAFERLRAALRPFTPSGELNTRERAEAEVAAALAGQAGPEWARARRLLGPECFTFLDRIHEQLAAAAPAAAPGAAAEGGQPLGGNPAGAVDEAALRQVALEVEGLRSQPGALAGESAQAGARRGVVVVAGVILALAGQAGARAQAAVRAALRGAWRSSSLVEGVNSVVRMQQRRQKRQTQGLLDLKRLYWNVKVFAAGKRKGTSPYGRLGLVLPKARWWDLLKRTPEQLRQELSQLNPPP